MKIGARYILIILGIALPLTLLGNLLLTRRINTVDHAIRTRERTAAAQRVTAVVNDRIRATAQIADSLATQRFSPEEQSFTQPALDALGLDLLILSDNLGNLLWSVHGSHITNSDPFPNDAARAILALPLQQPPPTGLFQLGTHPAIAAVRSINYSSQEGEVSGRLAVVRIITDVRLSELSTLAGVIVDLRRSASSLSNSSEPETISSFALSDDSTEGKNPLGGIIPGESFELLYKFPVPPPVNTQTLIISLSVILVTLVLLVIVASFLVVDGLILDMLKAITRQVRGLVDQPDPTIIAPCHPNDPIGTLVTEINWLLNRYSHSRQTAAHATRLAQGAIDNRTEFVVSISHEVRSPLNAILGIAQIMERMSLPIHLREYVHIVKESGNTLLGLINDMLDFSSLEAGKVTFLSGPFNIQELLTNVVLSHAAVAFKKNVEVIVDISPTAPTHVEGDRLRVKQILSTLISNAITFTDVAEVTVRLEGRNADEQKGTRVHISVKDSGVGISPEREPFIFESFNSPESGSQKRLDQTGLSLPIARRLARGMGGELWVENRYGHGATFHLELTTTAISLTDDTVVPLDNTSEVLIVDHHPMSGANLSRILFDLGFSAVSEVTDGDLTGRLQGPISRPPLVFTDIRALSDGTLRKLQELGGKSVISWYVLVPPHLSVGAERFITVGATNVIPKPISRANLVEYLARPALHPDTIATEDSLSLSSRVRSSAGLSILVVDDIESNRFILETMLKSWGHHVTAASSGIEAINKLQERGHFDSDTNEHRFDLVFMDIQMPQINGLEATRIIRASEKLGSRKHPVPIIAVTADAQVKDIDEYVCVGMWGAITKPILALRLFGIIESLGLRDGQPTHSRDAHQRILRGDTDFVASLERRDLNFSVSRLWNDLGHDVGLLSNILHSFLEETERLLHNLNTLIERGGFEDISALGHALKGAFLNVGALGCAQVASSLERAARDNNLANVVESAQLLQKTTRTLLDAVQTALVTHQLEASTPAS